MSDNVNDKKNLLQLKDEFIAIYSHELKTPLTSIKAFSQLLNRHFAEKDDKKATQYLHLMTTQVDRLQHLVDDLLDVSKIQSGQIVFNQELFTLDNLIQEVIQQVQPLTTVHTISKENQSQVKVWADKYRIGQVLTNLLMNAIKYSPKGDKILVRSTIDKNYVTVSVQDYGIGIPQDKQDKIFKRYYRVKDHKRDSYPGLGLGLYISSQVMARHHGDLWLKSTENEGSTFYFSLPISPKQQ